jgi:tRNA G18 (ribose-2'-O)-methylase SpoU
VWEAHATVDGARMAESDGGLAPWYLIISNIAKRSNIGNICRSASAFGVKEILCVGRKKDVNFFGAHGSQAHVDFRFFNSLDECVAYLKGML